MTFDAIALTVIGLVFLTAVIRLCLWATEPQHEPDTLLDTHYREIEKWEK